MNSCTCTAPISSPPSLDLPLRPCHASELIAQSEAAPDASLLPMAFTVGRKHTDALSGPSVVAMNDGELLVAIGEGSSEAFEELDGRYRRAMLGLARSRLRDWGRAE